MADTDQDTLPRLRRFFTWMAHALRLPLVFFIRWWRRGWYKVAMLVYRLPLNQQVVLAGLAVGVISGIAASVLEKSVHLFESFGIHLLPGLSTGWRIAGTLAIPTAGGLIAGITLHYFCPEARGHGIAEVMNAIKHRGGQIQARVGFAKLLATAATLGSGGSAGREGPIVQIGAAVGSWLGRVFRAPAPAVKTLVSAGAVGGLSAAFSIPLAGVFFTMEVILRNFANRAFPAVVVASVTGTVTARLFLNTESFFTPLNFQWRHPAEFIFFALVGLLSAPVGRWYQSMLSGTDTFFQNLKRVPDYMKPALGGFCIGLIALGLPQIMGGGLLTINQVLTGQAMGWMLPVLLVGKLVATSITLGSGGAGGAMMPSLFIGAMLGAGVGEAFAWSSLSPMLPSALAAVGMACVFTSVFRAPVTAMVMAFELTQDYGILVPAMFACAITHLFARPSPRTGRRREKPPLLKSE
jgi:CIC family chloride channel protein